MSDWCAVQDPITKKTYYANRVTRETQWTPPYEFILAARTSLTNTAGGSMKVDMKQQSRVLAFASLPTQNHRKSSTNYSGLQFKALEELERGGTTTTNHSEISETVKNVSKQMKDVIAASLSNLPKGDSDSQVSTPRSRLSSYSSKSDLHDNNSLVSETLTDQIAQAVNQFKSGNENKVSVREGRYASAAEKPKDTSSSRSLSSLADTKAFMQSPSQPQSISSNKKSNLAGLWNRARSKSITSVDNTDKETPKPPKRRVSLLTRAMSFSSKKSISSPKIPTDITPSDLQIEQTQEDDLGQPRISAQLFPELFGIIESKKFVLQIQPIIESESNFLSNRIKNQGIIHNFESYAAIHFRLDKKTKIDTLLSHSSQQLHSPMCNFVEKAHYKTSLDMFRRIRSFMGDRKKENLTTVDSQNENARKLVDTAISSPNFIRDEMYCQLIKQLRNNPSDLSLKCGWELMIIVLSSICPSEELSHFLMSFFLQIYDTDIDTEMKEYAQECISLLNRTLILGSREFPPTRYEIELKRKRRPLIVKMYFCNSCYIMLAIDSQTTTRDIISALVQRFCLESSNDFGIFEIIQTPILSQENSYSGITGTLKNRFSVHENLLSDDYRISDIMSKWQSQEHLDQSTTVERDKSRRGSSSVSTSNEKKQNTLCFKMKFLSSNSPLPLSEISLYFMFIQAVHDVCLGKYTFTDMLYLKLAAIQLHAQYGEKDPYYYSVSKIRSIYNFVPIILLEKREKSWIETTIIRQLRASSFFLKSRMEMEASYISLVREHQLYGSHFWFVAKKTVGHLTGSDLGYIDTIIGINEKGLHIIDPVTREIKQSISFSEILTYGYKDHSFLLVYCNATGNKHQMVFRTKNGKTIDAMVRIYIEREVDEKSQTVSKSAVRMVRIEREKKLFYENTSDSPTSDVHITRDLISSGMERALSSMSIH